LTGFFAPGAIVAEAFDVYPTSVGLKADRSPTRQITQPLAAGKLVGVIDRGLGVQRACLFGILLEA
jgi:hypothetical protein